MPLSVLRSFPPIMLLLLLSLLLHHQGWVQQGGVTVHRHEAPALTSAKPCRCGSGDGHHDWKQPGCLHDDKATVKLRKCQHSTRKCAVHHISILCLTMYD